MAIIFFLLLCLKCFRKVMDFIMLECSNQGINVFLLIHWKIYFLKFFPCFLHLVYIYIFKIFINLFFILIENPKQEWLNKYFFLQF